MAPKLDRKFTGMITKVKDAHPGYLGSIVPNDQWIVFLAKDNAFAGEEGAIYAYRDRCIALGCDAEQVAATERLIEDIQAWRAANPGLCKNPDAKGEVLLP